MTGTGELTTDDRPTLYYSGHDTNVEGVGLLVRKDSTDSVINYSSISNRIISIRVKAKPIYNHHSSLSPNNILFR